MTDIRPLCILKMVVGVLACWWVLEVSPFAVAKFLLEVAVVGGKGGVMMMLMWWGPGGPVYALRFIVVVAVHSRCTTLPQFTGV